MVKKFKSVTEEQQAGGLMMSMPVFLWKSLPKSGKSGEKGRESRACLLEISTQIGEIRRKGRESQ
ncbi:MAG TPA: hypothetical protein DCM21_05485 [Butyrivibrio sp.]|nr:hypothetical protein [Butyrivibrio sp.]